MEMRSHPALPRTRAGNRPVVSVGETRPCVPEALEVISLDPARAIQTSGAHRREEKREPDLGLARVVA